MNPSAPALPRWPPGTRGAIIFGIVLIGASKVVIFGLAGAVARSLGLSTGDVYDGSPRAFVALGIGAILAVGLVFGVGMRWVGRTSLDQSGWKPFRGRDLLCGLGGFVISLLLMLATAEIQGNTASLIRTVVSFSADQRVFFVLLGVFAAFTEETIFRGVLQPALQARIGCGAGIVVTAVLFAATHFRFRPLVLVNLTGIGLVFGGLRERTGSLWAPAITHALIWSVMGSA